MNKTSEVPEFTTSYLDLKKNATQIGRACGEFTEMWVKYMHNTMMQVLGELANGTEEAAKKAFLDALEVAKKNSAKMVDKMTGIMAEQVGDAYNVGFNEGAHMANSLNSKTLRKLIADGSIDDSRGQIEAYLKVCDKVHADALATTMKGRALNLYTGGSKNDEKENNAR